MENSWTFGQFLVGIFISGVGFIVVWKADWMLRNFGSIPFAEKYLSTEGGTRVFYKLVGMLIMVGGMMHATNLLAPTMTALVERFFGRGAGR